MCPWSSATRSAPLAVEPLGDRVLPASVSPTVLALFAASRPDAFAEFVGENSALFAGPNPGLFGAFGAADGDFTGFLGEFGGVFAAQGLAGFPSASPQAAAAANPTVFPAFAGSEGDDFADFAAGGVFFPSVATPPVLFANNVLANLAAVNPLALVTQFSTVNPTLLAGFAGSQADAYRDFAAPLPPTLLAATEPADPLTIGDIGESITSSFDAVTKIITEGAFAAGFAAFTNALQMFQQSGDGAVPFLLWRLRGDIAEAAARILSSERVQQFITSRLFPG